MIGAPPAALVHATHVASHVVMPRTARTPAGPHPVPPGEHRRVLAALPRQFHVPPSRRLARDVGHRLLAGKEEGTPRGTARAGEPCRPQKNCSVGPLSSPMFSCCINCLLFFLAFALFLQRHSLVWGLDRSLARSAYSLPREIFFGHHQQHQR